MGFSVLVDLTQCAGGRACVPACKRQNGLPGGESEYATIQGKRKDCFIGTDTTHHRPKLSADNFTVVECHDSADNANESNWIFVKRQCMHCLEPACESACPVKALERLPEGPVIYHPKRCMGCRYCMMACPFSVPTYQWDQPIPYIRKCTFCKDRILKGDTSQSREDHIPACVSVCPTNCLQFGQRDELLEEAHRRIDNNPGNYVNHVYGETEGGGTSWLYLSAVPFARLGFPQNIGDHPYPEYTEVALASVPPLIVFGSTFLAGMYLLWKRKLKIAAEADDSPSSDSEETGSE